MAAMRLLRFLTILAMLSASVGMVGAGHAQAASPAPVATPSSGHCGDGESGKRAPDGASIDCTIACAALPSAPPVLDGELMLRTAPQPVPAAGAAGGLDPGADPPPPRSS